MKLRISHEVAVSAMTQNSKLNNSIDPVSIHVEIQISAWQRFLDTSK